MRPLSILRPVLLVCLLILVRNNNGSTTSLDDMLMELVVQGDTARADGKYDAAVSIYLECIEQMEMFQMMTPQQQQKQQQPLISLPTRMHLYANLAWTLSAGHDNDHTAAMEYYQQALAFYDDEHHSSTTEEEKERLRAVATEVAFLLGTLQQDVKLPAKAIETYQKILTQLDPNHWASYASIAAVYNDAYQDRPQTLVAYYRAYQLLASGNATNPTEEPWKILSEILTRIGFTLLLFPEGEQCTIPKGKDGKQTVDCHKLAVEHFRLALEHEPDNEEAQHMLASMTADASVKRAPNKYIENLFDNYAADFDDSLVERLQYTGYERLRRGFDRAMSTQLKTDEHKILELVLDAGCGTGLAGEQFRNISRTLIGVDLSAGMIRQAQLLRPGLYDATRVGDLMDVYAEFAGKISLIVAADSYLYFGDLAPLMEAMVTGLQPGGYAAMTLEDVQSSSSDDDDDAPNSKWKLTRSGRFAHRRSYVEGLCQEAGLVVVRYEHMDGFRYEWGEKVQGHIFVLQKPE